ncbi:class I SAM-dependent methyltransferase [Gracilibacillus caseinilyticus]|uniref:Class I SAM-dependent methyltransferase n=1 Tax=Gracilibacillus caseinilyticus TaxID=2932256 RepID=A0ABY4EU08_9BACI|nr:class I SAM-dependent methyltransferase [Gracilibacillus caseinilyticus]UOQ47373.1 class I SAM-dependent methyltransferase [Gracilibacillus caseinilyticus]
MVYSKLAYIYDMLMDDELYDNWQAFVEQFIKGGQLLDLGCGTGRMSKRFANAHFSVTGVDLSEDMLAYAQSSSSGIQYIQQDIRELNGLHGFDAVVSLCDVINYITSTNDLETVFRNVRHCLVDGGYFIFDIHSLKHFAEDMIGHTFSEIYEDITYVWLCEQGEEVGSVEHDLTFFLLDELTGQYQRFDEQHVQRTFAVDTYVQLLEQTGFDLQGIYGDFSVTEAENPEENERIFFVCKKN